MSSARRWSAADEYALSWLTEVAVSGGTTGYDVGPMPDRVFVLHPLVERVDGNQMDAGYRWGGPDVGDVWADAAAPERARRTLGWRDYAQRMNIPMFVPPYWPGLHSSLPGVWEDSHVTPPAEGSLADPATRDALLAILRRHTAGDGDQLATAMYYDFWLLGHPAVGIPAEPHILRGPLDAARELFDRPGYLNSPQNLWPDDHSWVLYTDEDAWATAISGGTALMEDILQSPELEAVRIPELDETS